MSAIKHLPLSSSSVTTNASAEAMYTISIEALCEGNACFVHSGHTAGCNKSISPDDTTKMVHLLQTLSPFFLFIIHTLYMTTPPCIL